MKIKFITLFLLLIGHQNFAQNLDAIKKSKPLKLMGSLGIGSTYAINSTSSSQFNWYLNGAPTLQLYSFTFPFSFSVSDNNRNFTQPFHQYGVSPYYKNFTAHIGYRNMQFSEYTLANQTFLGAGVEFNLSKFRVGAMYGQFSKAVDIDTLINKGSQVILPTYRRIGIGAKIGFGNKLNFIDFIFFKSSDDENSLNHKADSLLVGVKPGENLASGIKINLSPIKNIQMDIDAGSSLVTDDKRRIDNFGEAQNKIPTAVTNLVSVNYSSHLYLGGHASLSYSLKSFRIKFLYKYIEPEYKSFGSNYIQGDLQDITISPSINFLKGKINLNSSVGQRKNNLQNNKAATTIRTIGSANLNLNLSQKVGMGFNYSNFGVNQNNGRVLLNDSIKVSTINQSYGFNIRFQHIKPTHHDVIMLLISSNNMNDNNIVTKNFSQSNTIIGNLSFIHNWVKKFRGITFSIAANHVSIYKNDIVSVGPNLGFNQTTKNQKIKLNLNGGYQYRMKNNLTDGGVLNINSDLNYSINKKNTISCSIYIINNTSSNTSSYSFNEQRFALRYLFNF